MVSTSPTTYGLLGMLANRSWTGYELTQQVRRSLRFVWPVSEGHLYREQKRLVELGWVSMSEEPAGRRTRKRYAITDAGRAALREWIGTAPEEPHLQIEGVLRAFYADQGTPAELTTSMRATATMAAAMLAELHSFTSEYLAEDGPLEMLEKGLGGPKRRLAFRGRPMYPERLHAVALAVDLTTRILEVVDDFFTSTADEVAAWPSTTDPSVTPQTRARLEHIQVRGSRTRSGPSHGATVVTGRRPRREARR